MTSTATRMGGFTRERTRVLREIRKMREAMEDLTDCLDLLEARARNRGKATYSIHEAKQRLGL